MKKNSRKETEKEVDNFFKDIKNKSPKEIEKMKKLAMSQNIKLKEQRKKFCKKCLMPYKTPKIRIRNGIKSVTCENCGYISRYKIKLS
jgi:RNase P subunit RPR2